MSDRKTMEGRRVETLHRLSELWPDLAKARLALAVRFCDWRKAQIHARFASNDFHPLQNRSGEHRNDTGYRTN